MTRLYAPKTCIFIFSRDFLIFCALLLSVNANRKRDDFMHAKPMSRSCLLLPIYAANIPKLNKNLVLRDVMIESDENLVKNAFKILSSTMQEKLVTFRTKSSKVQNQKFIKVNKYFI